MVIYCSFACLTELSRGKPVSTVSEIPANLGSTHMQICACLVFTYTHKYVSAHVSMNMESYRNIT